MTEDYPKITFQRLEVADDLGGVVEKANYNFDQIAMFSDLVKIKEGKRGKRGLPGATGIGLPGVAGETGSLIHYVEVSIPNGASVTDPEHRTDDTIIDVVPKFMKVIEDGLGNRFYDLQLNLAAVLTTDYLINQYDYLTSNGTAITKYIQRNYTGSPNQGNPGSENLALVKRVDNSDSEFYRLMVGTDRYLNDPTDISIYIANILPEDGVNANDPSLPQYSQIGLKYRPDSDSNLSVNTAYIKYHEVGNKWTYSVINAGVGIYTEYDMSNQNNNTVYLRGRKVKLIGNTANINAANINKHIEFDVDTYGGATMTVNDQLDIVATTIDLLVSGGNIRMYNGGQININSGNNSVNVSGGNAIFSMDNEFYVEAEDINIEANTDMNIAAQNVNVNAVINFQDSAILADHAAFKVDISSSAARDFIKRSAPSSILVTLGNTSDNINVKAASGVYFDTPIYANQDVYGKNLRRLIANPSGYDVFVGADLAVIRLHTGGTNVYHRRGTVDYTMWDSYNDGAGSGLDADVVDGIQAASFMRSDQNDDFVGTLNYTPDNGVIISLDGVALLQRHDGRSVSFGADDGVVIGSGESRATTVTNVNMITEILYLSSDNAINFYSNLQNGWASRRTMEFRTDGGLYIDGYKTWHQGNDGVGSALDADLLDGQHGAFYRDAANLNAGLVPLARIPATLTGKDADTLDGQHGAYYRDAANLNAGLIPLARIPATLTGKSADQVDGLHATSFLRSDADDSFSGALSYSTATGAVLKFGNDIAIERLTSNGGMLVGCDDMLILGAGEGAQTIKNYVGSKSTEDIHMGADYDIYFHSYLAGGWANRKTMKFDSTGELFLENSLRLKGNYDAVINFDPGSDYSAFIYTIGTFDSYYDAFIFRMDTTRGTPNWGNGLFSLDGDRGYGYSQNGWLSRSDKRIKENIKTLVFGDLLEKIGNIRLATFNFITDERKTEQIGVIAPELEKDFPDFVKENPMEEKAVKAGLPSVLKNVDYSKMSLLGIAGVQELMKENKLMKKQINNLTKKNKELENRLKKIEELLKIQ